jgi:hypothetical protein
MPRVNLIDMIEKKFFSLRFLLKPIGEAFFYSLPKAGICFSWFLAEEVVFPLSSAPVSDRVSMGNTAEDLSRLWGKFNLLDEESEGITILEDYVDPLVYKGKSCVVGKLLANRIVTKEIIRIPLLRAWKLMGSLSFHLLGENIFLFEFEYEWDKSRVMKGQPWLFDGHLVSLMDFYGYSTPPTQM